MRHIVCLSFLSGWLRLVVLGVSVTVASGCAVTRTSLTAPAHPEQEVERNQFAVARGDDVIGRLAVMNIEAGDTLPDIGRHFSVGVNALSAANPGMDMWIPEAGTRITLPLSFILPDAPRKGIVVNLATMRLFQYKQDGDSLKVSTYPVGVGTKERPTPTGRMVVSRKASRPTWHVPASIAEDHRKKGDILPAKVPPGPENPLGDYALYLSKQGYLIHGTNKPASIGLEASNGCLRLYPENIRMLYQDTSVNTPVLIVNQPYLVGERGGVLYMEAHRPLAGSDDRELERIYERLKRIENNSARRLDWKTISKVKDEARGIPVPITETPAGGGEAAEAWRIEHPAAFRGRPVVPELKLDAWYVLAGDVHDEADAQRIAAMINHQGPPIPARVLPRSSKDNGYRVIAGPFSNIGAANDAVKRLKMDLDIDGLVIEPVKKI